MTSVREQVVEAPELGLLRTRGPDRESLRSGPGDEIGDAANAFFEVGITEGEREPCVTR